MIKRSVKIYCYHNNEFVAFLETDVLPRKYDIIRIHRPHKGYWEYVVLDTLYIFTAPNKDQTVNRLESIRIDLINPFNSCKEEEIP